MNESDRLEVQEMIDDAQLGDTGFFGQLFLIIKHAMSESRFYLIVIVIASYVFVFLLISDIITPQVLSDLFEQLQNEQAIDAIKAAENAVEQ